MAVRSGSVTAVMRRWCLVALAVAGVLPVSAVPAPQASEVFATVTFDPAACAKVSPATASFLAVSPLATPTVAASIAHECLKSVPNKAGPAVDLINSLKAFAQWQSTLAWLKDPPASYMLPPTDIEGKLDMLAATAQAGGFQSEYDFQLAIFQTFASAHDGHFAFRGDVFKAFGFRNTMAMDIISVSRDGLEVPKLYHLSELEGNSSATAKAIVRINGRDAAELIQENNLKYSGYQDPDSQWNSQFRTTANPGALMIVAASLAFQGDRVTFTYEDGSEKSEDSFAILRAGADFAGVNNGEDYYNRFCNPANLPAAATTSATSTTTSSASSTATIAVEPTISGYPFPFIRDQSSNTTAGYFLNGTGFEDVAVLVVTAFAPGGTLGALEYLTDFQKTLESFFAMAKAAGKERLVIDVTTNGGGYVVAGYELFAQLFPEVQRFQADNMRLADSLVNMARITGSIPGDFNASTPEEQAAIDSLVSSSIVSNLVPGGVYTPDGQELTSVDSIIAPVSLKNDLFTSYMQTPLNMTGPFFNLTGTGSRSNPAPAAFAPENIVILTDGTCGSTCTLFSYLAILQLNIKTVSVGGRPQTGPMQSVAGVEGAQVFYMNEMSEAANAVIALAPVDRRPELEAGELGVIAKGYALGRATNPASPGSVNGKNAFMSNNAQTPLQFLYQPANCRFFYTVDMIRQPEAVWRRAVEATWTNPEAFCVEGSRVAANNSQDRDPLFQLVSNAAAAIDSAAPGRTVGGESLLLALVLGLLTVVASWL